MPAADDEVAGAQLATLVKAQAAARRTLTKQAVAMATQAAQGFRHWYETDAITEWATKLASRIEALQRSQAQTTDAYLARATSQIVGGRIQPVGRIDVAGLRAGVTHAGAYGRAADVYRYRQSQVDAFTRKLAAADITNGKPILSGVELVLPDLSDPTTAAIDRVGAVADLDIQLADRAQADRFVADQPTKVGVTGQRRVIHPELSRGGTCGLCIAVSDRIYHVGKLRPIHGHCECTTLPIVGDKDPGSGLNSLDLKKLYRDAGNTTSADALKRTRYKIDEHGELGPVLTDGTFRSAKQAQRDARQQSTSPNPVKRNDLERILAAEQSAQERAHDLAKSDPNKWRGYAASLDSRIADLQAQIAA